MSNELTLQEALARIAELETAAVDRVKNRKVTDRPKDSIGYQIYQRRIAAGLTMRRLAERIGVTSTGICDAEKSHHSPSVATLRKIATGLGCKTWEIVKDWEEQA
jgi:DNA-binding XRE family transcriptional regulator